MSWGERNHFIVRSWAVTFLLAMIFLLFLKPDPNSVFGLFGVPVGFAPSSWATLQFCIVLVSFCVYSKTKGLDLFGGAAVALVGIVGVSTLFNQGNMSTWVTDWLPRLSVVLIVATCAKRYMTEVLRAFFFASTFYLLCNLVFIFQNGGLQFDSLEYTHYGYRNVTYRIAIPAFICSLLLDNLEGSRFSVRSWTVYFVALCQMLVGYSATSVCAFVIVGLLVLLSQWSPMRLVFNGATYVALSAAAFLGVVVARIQDKLAFFIEGVMHRTVTFTGRTFIWDASMQLLSNSHFFTGYGASYIWNSIVVNGQAYMHAHNEVLHILMSGGVFALLAFVFLIALVVRRLFNDRNALSSAYLSAGICGLLTIGLVESLLTPVFLFLLAVGYYWNDNERPRMAA